MADLHTKTCDECGAIKREANHWFVALRQFGFFTVARAGEGCRTFADYRDLVAIDLCSEQCAVKAMSKALAKKEGVNV